MAKCRREGLSPSTVEWPKDTLLRAGELSDGEERGEGVLGSGGDSMVPLRRRYCY